MVENLARAHHQYTPLSGVYISAQEIYTPLSGVYISAHNIHPCHFPIPTCSLLFPTEDARCVNNGNAFQHLRIGARALEPENLKSRIWPAENIENLKSGIWPAEDIESLKSRIWPAEDIENLKSRIWPGEDIGNLKSRIWPAEDIENLKSRIGPAEDVLAQMMTGICDPPVQEGISKLAQRPELLLGVHLVLIVNQS